MTPAAVWVTWTQPHMIITAAISNYQSQLIQSACFTLHKGPIISFLHLSVSLKQLIFQWNRCMAAGAAGRLGNGLFGFFWTAAASVVVKQAQQDCVSSFTVLLRPSPEDHVRSASSSVCSRPAAESASELSELLRTVWARGGPRAEQTHQQMPSSGSVRRFQRRPAPAEALGCLNLSVWERCCVAPGYKYRSSSSVYTGVIHS